MPLTSSFCILLGRFLVCVCVHTRTERESAREKERVLACGWANGCARFTYPLQTYSALHLSYEPTPPPFGNNCEPPETQIGAALLEPPTQSTSPPHRPSGQTHRILLRGNRSGICNIHVPPGRHRRVPNATIQPIAGHSGDDQFLALAWVLLRCATGGKYFIDTRPLS